MALLMLVLTGFAALAIDSGIGYDQSRSNQDVADAAALAASYYLYANQGGGSGSIADASQAAANVASLDCTGASAPCSVTLAYYSSSGYTSASDVLCSATFSTAEPASITQSGSGCSDALGDYAYVGVSIQSAGHTYFGGPVSGQSGYDVNNQAVAQVEGGSGSGSGGGTRTLSCALCILANQGGYGLTIPAYASGLDMTSAGSDIDVNGGYSCASGASSITIDTTGTGAAGGTGHGKHGGQGGGGSANPAGWVNVAGTYADDCATDWIPQTGHGTATNLSTGATPIPDPLASMQMPSLSTYATCTQSLTISGVPGDFTTTTTVGTSTTTTTSSAPYAVVEPGCYGQITIDSQGAGGYFWGGFGSGGGGSYQGAGCPGPGAGLEAVFDSGLYVIYGGLTVEGDGTTVSSETCDSPDGGDTFYFVCANAADNGPTACPSSGAVGAGLTLETYGEYQWNIFPPTAGPQANMIIIYDRNNTAPIISAATNEDPDSDHNGAIYAASATYYTENCESSSSCSSPSLTSGSGEATALGCPIIVDYMVLADSYGGGGGYGTGNFALDHEVPVPAGGPGGLVS